MQVTLYERTGVVKVQYTERSVALLRTGAVGLQMTTDDALNIPNDYFDYSSARSCPQDLTVVYTPGGVAVAVVRTQGLGGWGTGDVWRMGQPKEVQTPAPYRRSGVPVAVLCTTCLPLQSRV
jgi:hypothetical protein